MELSKSTVNSATTGGMLARLSGTGRYIRGAAIADYRQTALPCTETACVDNVCQSGIHSWQLIRFIEGGNMCKELQIICPRGDWNCDSFAALPG